MRIGGAYDLDFRMQSSWVDRLELIRVFFPLAPHHGGSDKSLCLDLI